MPGVTERSWIDLPDGERLAVTLYLPRDVPAPCLLEALPYRKDDLTSSYEPEYLRFRDEYAYAVARVDLRGTGSSSGIALDEYHAQEHADLRHAIGWLAGQDWCSGAVGMFGTSWSGFNALQMACERPPALRAVVSAYASDDRWTDDVHYMGGALRLLDLVDYPLYMVAMNGLPPVPQLFGEGWHEGWRRRAEGSPPWLLEWLTHQEDGPYWRHGSVRPGYERIACPTMLIAGWADGYRNVGYRTVHALATNGTPVRLLVGPWSHQSPALSVPGPNIDHVPMMARWWDRWLRGQANGVESEPAITVFVRGYGPPAADAPSWPGRWEAHDAAVLGPILDGERDLTLDFAAAQLRGAEMAGSVATYRPVADVGLTAWNSCAAAQPWGQPEDQTPDDARSLVLEWDVPASTVVMGHPRVRLRLRPDHEVAYVSAKLSLVPAAGRPSLLVDRGLLNLAYRDADLPGPHPCVPGEWLDVQLELEATAFETPAADADGAPFRLRLALACADWPNTVAPPGTWSTVDPASSSLLLPLAPDPAHPQPQLPSPLPHGSDDGDDEPDGGSHVRWQHGRDVLARVTWAEVEHGSRYRAELGSRCQEHYDGRVEIEPSTGVQRVRARATYQLAWPPGDGSAAVSARSEARLDLRVDRDAFDVSVELDVDDGDEPLVRNRWHRLIPRNLA